MGNTGEVADWGADEHAAPAAADVATAIDDDDGGGSDCADAADSVRVLIRKDSRGALSEHHRSHLLAVYMVTEAVRDDQNVGATSSRSR